MIGTECMSCKEPKEADQNNENDQNDEDEVKESCEQLYQQAGKCEYNLNIQYPNNYGCNFMEGIKIVRRMAPSSLALDPRTQPPVSSSDSSRARSFSSEDMPTTSRPSLTVPRSILSRRSKD